MKLECIKEKLLNSVSIAERTTSKNHALKVLGCLLLEAKNGSFYIRSTNLDIGVEINIPAKIKREGIVAVPGTVFYNVISNIYDSSSVVIEVVNDNLSITTKSSQSLIKAVSHEDFPTIPRDSSGQSLTLKSSDVSNGFKSVWYSASSSAIKPELSSVYIYSDGGKIYFVSTDSFRLSEKSITVRGVDGVSTLIPSKNVAEIIKVLESVDDSIEVVVGENQASFASTLVYATSRVIDGSFPDYKQIIPKEILTEIIVMKQDFINALKKVNIFSDAFHQITFTIDPKQKTFFLSAINADVGETTERLQASISGEELNIHFNHRYIADCLQSITADSIVLSFGGPGKPLLIQGVSDDSFLYLVMPMNK